MVEPTVSEFPGQEAFGASRFLAYLNRIVDREDRGRIYLGQLRDIKGRNFPIGERALIQNRLSTSGGLIDDLCGDAEEEIEQIKIGSIYSETEPLNVPENSLLDGDWQRSYVLFRIRLGGGLKLKEVQIMNTSSGWKVYKEVPKGEIMLRREYGTERPEIQRKDRYVFLDRTIPVHNPRLAFFE